MALADPAPEASAPEQSPTRSNTVDWNEFFTKPVDPTTVRGLVRDFNQSNRHEDIIALIEQAILHGQIQPWMYEVLALSMEAVGRPAAQVERVLLSSPDFMAGDSDSLLFLAAYLTRFGRYQQALNLYRQIAVAEPYRIEPYVMGLSLAEKTHEPAEVAWTASGVLSQVWGTERQGLHQRAELLAAETRDRLLQQGRELEATSLMQVIADARQHDLHFLLDWNGTGDLELEVVDPTGVTANNLQPATPGGLRHIHSGQGPRQEDCYEEVLAPRALTGEYRLIIQHISGDIVGKRARLTVIRHEGTPQEERVSQSVPLDKNGRTIRLFLQRGRLQAPIALPLAPQAASSFNDSQRSALRQRLPIASPRAPRNGKAGALTANVGYQPVIANIPSGVQMSTLAIVSGDRRYVRLSMSPQFNSITDVFTFSFAAGGQQ